MKTEASLNASLDHLAEEYDILAHLLHGDMIVLHSRIYFLKVVQFVVVRREEGLCAVAIFVDIFNYRTGDGHSVICRRTAADLIQEHQRTRRKVVQDHRSLEHLHHKGRFAS